jgi:DNA repair protein RecO (recombination protein O)
VTIRARHSRADAIVLKQVPIGEADRVLTLFTREQGKQRAVAKGARRPGSRLGGHVDLLVRVRLQIAHGRSLDIVAQAETVDPYLPLRDDLVRMSIACEIAELVDRLTEDGQADAATFDSLAETLTRIAADEDPALAALVFRAHLLDRLGYRPELEHCIACRRELERVDCFFSAVAGGVMCTECGRADTSARAVSANAFAFLRRLHGNDYALLRRIRLGPDLRRDIEEIEHRRLAQLLDRDLRSSAFARRVQSLPR